MCTQTKFSILQLKFISTFDIEFKNKCHYFYAKLETWKNPFRSEHENNFFVVKLNQSTYLYNICRFFY